LYFLSFHTPPHKASVHAMSYNCSLQLLVLIEYFYPISFPFSWEFMYLFSICQ
jgi:hypothetical protein